MGHLGLAGCMSLYCLWRSLRISWLHVVVPPMEVTLGISWLHDIVPPMEVTLNKPFACTSTDYRGHHNYLVTCCCTDLMYKLNVCSQRSTTLLLYYGGYPELAVCMSLYICMSLFACHFIDYKGHPELVASMILYWLEGQNCISSFPGLGCQ